MKDKRNKEITLNSTVAYIHRFGFNGNSSMLRWGIVTNINENGLEGNSSQITIKSEQTTKEIKRDAKEVLVLE